MLSLIRRKGDELVLNLFAVRRVMSIMLTGAFTFRSLINGSLENMHRRGRCAAFLPVKAKNGVPESVWI